MSRGKQQVLLNYLPGKTFDFEKIGTIARVEHIRGIPTRDLNARLILSAISDEVQPWNEAFRPVFADMQNAGDRFVLVEPRSVDSAMFPLVFWCQNPQCGNVIETQSSVPASEACPRCRMGRLVQMRFVKVHRCGALEPLRAPFCTCASRPRLALDTRGGERIADFRWVCRTCRRTTSVFGGRCTACTWPGADPSLKNMHIEVHRAGRTYFPQFTVLLNQPGKELTAFLSIPEWPMLTAAALLELPGSGPRQLVEWAATTNAPNTSTFQLTDADRARLKSQGVSDEMVSQLEKLQQELQSSHAQADVASSPAGVAETVCRVSGVPAATWHRAGKELLEAVTPRQQPDVKELFSPSSPNVESHSRAQQAARRIGAVSVALVSDFPITTATFGYTRETDDPAACRLNPFPADPDHNGRFPIFVDVVQADAILLRLDHASVLEWLRMNGVTPALPQGTDVAISSKSYFVTLFDGISLRQSIASREARLVFGLLHTLSHLSVRRAALLCGLDGPSLSEYVLPRALTCAFYCNHRFGATIGALTALFDQSLAEWFAAIADSRRCVYDPVCQERGGNCHACTHLAETSCRFFNMNLGRSFLFGGPDPSGDGAALHGFFDALDRRSHSP
jgi:hypothetical protein